MDQTEILKFRAEPSAKNP